MVVSKRTPEWIYSTLAADPDLAPLVAEFVGYLPDRRAALGVLHASAEWAELKRAAHQLKGSAGSYGFDELTAAAARLENDVEQQAAAAIIAQDLRAIDECCQRIRVGVPTP